jgi:hypothetical protein
MMDIVVFQPYSLKNTENAGELAQVLSNMGTIGVEKNLPTAQGDMRGTFTYTVNSHAGHPSIMVMFQFDGEEELEETLNVISTWEATHLISSYYPIRGSDMYIADNGSVDISERISALTGGQY